MAFSIKTWVNRLSEFPNRRKLDDTGIANTYDVTRAEGTITTEGDKFDADTMNDLEQRIADGISEVEEAIPTTLPNPNAITFTVGYGGDTGTYTGAAAKTVSIPHLVVSTSNPSTVLSAGTIWGVY